MKTMIMTMALLLVCNAAFADDKETARENAKQATVAYNLGHYDEAAALYEEAYKLVQDPTLLYNLGQCYRQANILDKALTAYRSYLRTAPEDAPNRAKVQEWVGELEWTADIQSRSKKLETPKPSVDLTPRPTVAQTPQVDLTQSIPPKVEETTFKKWAPWVGVGLTAILGTVSLVEGLSAKSSFNSLQTSCGGTKTCTDSQLQDVKSKALVSNVFLGLTGASAVATGLTFYFR
jgi:tetratricopeptide (TPR) repeat protein